MRSIMFVGTGSDVGKSILNAAFCRIFLQDGYTPAPFKAQNLSLNSYATPQGLEIGRAQAMQAEACNIECTVEMNPLLLKPTSTQKSHVILNGKPMGDQTAQEFFKAGDRQELFDEVMRSYTLLAQQYTPIVIEGAGSISEMNLWKHDIVNMRVAVAAHAATYLVADIDRGGAFASVYGSLELLPPAERKRIKGIILNKFRGDISLFDEGRDILQNITGIPVVGIIPFYHDIYIDDEDSVSLDKKRGFPMANTLNVVVIRLKHLSNFTDFNLLERIPEINIYYSDNARDIAQADIIIIPGSKNTISDLTYLKDKELDTVILHAQEKGASIYGICGGYQIMGETISDPLGIEGDMKHIEGLGILPIHTTLTAEKTTEQCTFTFLGSSNTCIGYEIHMGETTTATPAPFCTIAGKKDDGYFLSPKIWGTYIHGIFDNFSLLNTLVQARGKEALQPFDVASFKNEQYDKLAQWVRTHTDMDAVYAELTPNT